MAEDSWLNRIVLADVYPRREDPFRPPIGGTPATAPAASQPGAAGVYSPPGASGLGSNIYAPWMTTPATRPFVFQRAYNLMLNVGTTPTRMMNQSFACDTMIISVPATAAASVFFGFGSFITAASGIEVQPGLPVAITPDNTREQWEVQRVLEAIAAMMAAERGWNPIGHYRAPRVVFDAYEYALVAGAGTIQTAVMLFNVPEFQ